MCKGSHSLQVAAGALLFVWSLAAPAMPPHRDYPLDPQTPACDDFYAHCCNGVSKGFKLAPNQQVYLFAAMDALIWILQARIDYLEALAARSPPVEGRTRTLRALYRACMDREAARADERTYVEELVRRVERMDRPAFQAFQAAGLTNGEYSLLTFETPVDQEDPGRLDLLFTSLPPALPAPSYYHQPEVLADLAALAQALFQTLGLSDPERRAKDAMDFQQALAAVYPDAARRRRLRLSRRTISRSDLLRRHPALRLDGFLKRVPLGTPIRNPTPELLTFLDRVLAHWPLARLRNAYLFAVLWDLLDDAYPEYRDRRLAFERSHLGAAPQRPDRRQRCIRWIGERFGKELDADLLPLLFPDFDREGVVSLVERVRTALVGRLGHNHWLSPVGRQAAQDKIAAVRMQLVAPRTPEEWDFNLPADYREDRPLYNLLTYRRKAAEKRLAALGRPRNRAAWEQGPLTVDAFYDVSENRLVLGQGILQDPYYQQGRPDWVNLGGIGVIVGHELGHAIDDLGSRYDASGRLHPWLSKADRMALHRRMERVLAVLKGAGLGELQLGEAVAELIGLEAAFAAAFPGGTGDTEAQQAFFVQYARSWCVKIRPGFQERLRRTDPHPQGAKRINLLLPQVEGFQRAFGCRRGDTLYLPPEERLDIW